MTTIKKFLLLLVVIILALVVVFVINAHHSVAPAQTPSASATLEANIRVFLPVAGQTLTGQLIVEGQARVFENQFSYRLLDASNTVLAQGSAYASASDVGQFGPFEIKTNYNTTDAAGGKLEVFDNSPKDGSVIDLVTVPVKFQQ